MAGVELSRLAFEFQLTQPDGPLHDPWQRLLNVAADFQVIADYRILWSEARFPVVEFAVQLATWLEASSLDPPPFAYESLESDAPGLIRLIPVSGGWSVATAWSAPSRVALFTLEEIREAAREFVERLRLEVRHAHGFDPLELRTGSL